MTKSFHVILILAAGLVGQNKAGGLPDEEPVQFASQIRPIFAKCLACHGPDEEHREGGLSLADRESALAELDSGARAIVPGSPEASELLSRVVESDESLRMPPPEHSAALSAQEVDLLRRWVAEGAPYARHWSLTPPQRPALPTVQATDWIQNPIDAFILARLEKAGLTPESEASRAKLIRRVSLDLTGLPPTTEELDAFLNDQQAGAYDRLVNRLLHSPRYGEHWARMWLDLARYADSQGYANDNLRTIWPYRDWVIRAFNRDLPFDAFTVEQLAGDLLPEPTEDQLIATAFHRNTMTNDEGGTDDEEFRHAAVVDRTNTTMQVWMGMTLGCAQCHTHKYDPLTHEEYYRFFAFFNQTADADRNDNAPLLSMPTAEQSQRLKEIETERAEAAGSGLEALNSERILLHERIATTPIMRELPPEKQRTTHIHLRGAFLDKGAVVEPGTPAAFHPWDPAAYPLNRLGLARWLVSTENPLTARVAVNRHWEKIFGRGLVETSEDFGAQGTLPSHPELLDWLAVEFVEQGWSMKELCRLLVTSATYRQSSRITPAKRVADPANRLLSRGPRRRLSAEQIRDYALAAGGLLSDKMFGPPVRPLQPTLNLKAAFGTTFDWDPSEGEDRYRRAIYTRWRRLAPYPSMAALDAPSRVTCTVRRIQTNTPVGVFVTLNDPAFVEAAQALAGIVMTQPQSDLDAQIRCAFRRVLSRDPSAAERTRVAALYQQQYEVFASHPDDAATLAARDASGQSPDQAIELAAWTVVSNVLLNLDEALTQN